MRKDKLDRETENSSLISIIILSFQKSHTSPYSDSWCERMYLRFSVRSGTSSNLVRRSWHDIVVHIIWMSGIRDSILLSKQSQTLVPILEI